MLEAVLHLGQVLQCDGPTGGGGIVSDLGSSANDGLDGLVQETGFVVRQVTVGALGLSGVSTAFRRGEKADPVEDRFVDVVILRGCLAGASRCPVEVSRTVRQK